MLNKRVLALMLSFSMLTSPLPIGGGINATSSSSGLSILGTGPSIVLTDETIPAGDAENVISPQEPENPDGPQGDDAPQEPENPDVSQGDDAPQEPENPDVSQGDVLPQEPENPDASQGDVLPQEPENPDAPQGDVLPQEPENPDVLQENITTYSEKDTASGFLICDFEDENGNWGMTGNLADSLSIKTDSSGNKYLYLNASKASTKSAVKSLGENIPRLATATVSFDWYIGNLTTDSRKGYAGIQLKSNGTEVFSLYHIDTRGAGAENPVLSYSAGGFDKKVDSTFHVDNIIDNSDKSSYAVEITFDFSVHKATLKVDGTVVAEDVEISAGATQIDTLELYGAGTVSSGNTFSWAMGIDDFAFTYEEPQAKKGEIVFDFENEESDDWGMTGNLADKGTVKIQEGGNTGKRLYVNVTKASTASAIKTFSDVTNLSEAVISFDWYIGNLTTDSRKGYAGIQLKSDGTEVFSLYHTDTRGAGAENPVLSYSAGGFDKKVDSTFHVDNIIDNSDKSSYAVEITFDFSAHKATLKVDGTVVAEDVEISAGASRINQIELYGAGTVSSGNTFSWITAIDNFKMTYTENLAEILPSIYELSALPNVGCTQVEMQGSYQHPSTVEAKLLTGETISVPIKMDTWVSTPVFNENAEDIYTWEAEIDPPAENENVNNLKATYQMSYDVLRKVTDADGTVVVNTDFENEIAADWGMTAGGSGITVGIVNDPVWNGNMWLQFATKDVTENTSTTKKFGLLPKMTTAKMEFEWNVGTTSSTDRAGWQGIIMKSGENELFSLWINDVRSGETKPLYYSVNGFEGKNETGKTVTSGSVYDVELAFDFSTHKLTMKLDGNDVVSVDILEIARNVDGLSIDTVVTASGKNVNGFMSIDDFFFAYVEDTSISDEKVTIYSLDSLPTVAVTQEEWEANTYKHPTTVSAMLTSGDKIDVEIDASTWTCDEFDPNKKAAYTWTADIIAPAENENTKNLKASYTMEYYATMTSEHDYYNDFTFSSEVCPSTAWGNLDQTSGTGYLTLSHKSEDNGNGYMFASVTNAGGGRGTRIDFSTNAVKGAEISFDWMPVTAAPAGVASGNIDFFSPSNRQNYFTLRFDSDYKITYFTKGDYNNTTVQPEFDGSISEDDRVDTGLSGQNKWFTVKLAFDYFAHTAKLEIAERDDPSKSYTAEVPIEASANGLSIMVMRLDRTQNDRSNAEMGLDNIVLDYTPFDSDWIVGVKNPANVNVAKSQWDQFTFPETVEVTLGDNSKTQVPVEQWTAEPAFELETSEAGEYVWTAQLVPGELKNVFDYSVSFTMNFTSYPFPTYVYNPNTLELLFGQELPAEFPKEVTAKMSDGTMGTVTVGEWTAIRAFNAEEEGIYVYGANIVPVEGAYDVVQDKLSPNENPDAPRDDKDAYVYDVYYRISYAKDADNYNGYVRTMENLDRGVYAIAVDGGVFVSWRLLAEEYGADKEISFDVYRGSTKVNAAPITNKTNLVDAAGKAGDVYTVVKTQAGEIFEGAKATASENNYLSIPVQKPDPQPTKNGDLSAYTLNDMGVADVDGDGEYEFIVKWYPDNAFDSGMANGPSSPTIFDLYELDGTPLWRLNLGLEMPSGAHFNQFMLYDLDEDGKAELFIKTSDGTISYKPNAEGKFDMNDESTIVSYIGDRNVKPGTNIESNGHVNKNSNEYVTVFNGLTGEVIDSIAYENTTGEFTDWGTTGGGGNDGGNRSARYNIAIAYLPKAAGSTETIPAVLFNRGYYAKTTVIAYTLRDGKLQKEWNFVRQIGENEAGKGNHNMSTGDIDKDGFDELIIGALAIDHDGSVLWVKDGKEGQDFSGHADTIHLAAMNPDNNDLYVFTPNEDKEISTMNAALVNARTGARISGSWFTLKDVGRAIAANITPRPGYEYWSASTGSGIYAFDGTVLSDTIPVSMNWRMYWDGDLLSELGDGIATDDDWAITKYDWVNNKVDTLTVLEGTKTNNSTKKTPSLTADLFGDWREEVVLRNEDDTEIRIYMTTEETDYMIYTLMHDPVYRNAVANQNTAYNQPPHVGFYLGEDNRDTVLAMGLPTAKIKYGTPREEKAVFPDIKEDVPEPSEEVKQKLSEQGIVCNTAEELKDYLANDVASKVLSDFQVEIPNANTVVWEIAIKVQTKVNGVVVTEEEATADNFPAGGVKILLDYPEGTNGTDYNFVVRHLITMCPEDKVGEIVDETVTKTEKGLELLISGASPFAIGWYRVGAEPTPSPAPEESPAPGQTPQPEESPAPTPQPEESPAPGQTPQPEESPKPVPSSQPDEDDEDDEDDSVVNTSEEQVSIPAKTGDHMGRILVMCIALIGVSGMGIGVTMFIRYRRKK